MTDSRTRVFLLALSLAQLAGPLGAQTPAPAPERDWYLAFYLDGYFGPSSSTYFAPTVFADHGALHLEGRYNYEDLRTGSLFAGWTFAFGGDRTSLTLTPMLGGFFGNSNGVAPGLEVEGHWGRLAYWLESEYAFYFDAATDDYFYSWSELNFFLIPRLWIGASAQRLKLVDTPREVDFGPMLGFGKPGAPGAALSLYAYGLGTSTTWYLATLSIQF